MKATLLARDQNQYCNLARFNEENGESLFQQTRGLCPGLREGHKSCRAGKRVEAVL